MRFKYFRFERDLKEDLAKFLREAFDKALEKIDDAVKNGKEIHKEALQRVRFLNHGFP